MAYSNYHYVTICRPTMHVLELGASSNVEGEISYLQLAILGSSLCSISMCWLNSNRKCICKTAELVFSTDCVIEHGPCNAFHTNN